jgi:transcription termination/antitermination protein NusG
MSDLPSTPASNPFLNEEVPADKPLPRLDVIGTGPIKGPVVGGTQPEDAVEPEAEVEETPEGEDATPADGAPAAEDEFQWYFVNCYSGYENKVKTALAQRIEMMGAADLIKDVLVPTERETEVKDGKKREVERRLYPGYILVRMKINEKSTIVVKGTNGVSRFIGMGDAPTPLSKQEVDMILHRMESAAPKVKVNFRVGQKVRITDGPFADFIGVVEHIDTEHAKVKVLVSFFGRDTPVELDFLQVERT